jgi:hypothetical protein
VFAGVLAGIERQQLQQVPCATRSKIVSKEAGAAAAPRDLEALVHMQ